MRSLLATGGSLVQTDIKTVAAASVPNTVGIGDTDGHLVGCGGRSEVAGWFKGWGRGSRIVPPVRSVR